MASTILGNGIIITPMGRVSMCQHSLPDHIGGSGNRDYNTGKGPSNTTTSQSTAAPSPPGPRMAKAVSPIPTVPTIKVNSLTTPSLAMVSVKASSTNTKASG